MDYGTASNFHQKAFQFGQAPNTMISNNLDPLVDLDEMMLTGILFNDQAHETASRGSVISPYPVQQQSLPLQQSSAPGNRSEPTHFADPYQTKRDPYPQHQPSTMGGPSTSYDDAYRPMGNGSAYPQETMPSPLGPMHEHSYDANGRSAGDFYGRIGEKSMCPPQQAPNAGGYAGDIPGGGCAPYGADAATWAGTAASSKRDREASTGLKAVGSAKRQAGAMESGGQPMPLNGSVSGAAGSGPAAVPAAVPAAAPGAAKAKRAPRVKKTPEQQRADRRERNRRHARCSRARKKVLIDALQKSIKALQGENRTLKGYVEERFGEEEGRKLFEAHAESTRDTQPAPAEGGLVAEGAEPATTQLEDGDFAFVKALKTGKQNFVITDPQLPDNPIVYASQGFMDITGYALDEVLGRNCRFIQGPATDLEEVAKLRKAILDGGDISVCFLNYRKDGSTFWNQVYVAPLRNQYNEIVNFVGVQCEVASNLAQSKASAKLKGAGDGSDDEDDDDDEYD